MEVFIKSSVALGILILQDKLRHSFAHLRPILNKMAVLLVSTFKCINCQTCPKYNKHHNTLKNHAVMHFTDMYMRKIFWHHVKVTQKKSNSSSRAQEIQDRVRLCLVNFLNPLCLNPSSLLNSNVMLITSSSNNDQRIDQLCCLLSFSMSFLQTRSKVIDFAT